MGPNGTMTSVPSPMPGFLHHPPVEPVLRFTGPALPTRKSSGRITLSNTSVYAWGAPGAGPANNMMPYPIQWQNQPGPWVGFMRGATNMQQHFQLQHIFHSANRKLGNEIHRSCGNHGEWNGSMGVAFGLQISSEYRH
ncbi:hypothetical protein F2Q70_00015893 [Brassica cretica]|uniref:Uncharacterized protein n=1 Tax=Brassica cretica TaxID=69181 RepID=A0A3N6SK36_BRACR|nr:hypothetical protein F2Q70_00015893 [Brassica cretica]